MASITDATPDSLQYWEQRAKAAEEALKVMAQCFAILCDREENGVLLITDAELIAVPGSPTLVTFHNKREARMEIRHVKE